MLTPTITNSFRQKAPDEQRVYDHLLYCVQTEKPQDLLDRFRRLFVGGRDYSPVEVRSALEKIVSAKEADEEFKFILNRCCHILVNRWQMNPQNRWAIPELVKIFEDIPPIGSLQARGARRLRQLVREFRDTEQYLTLQRLGRVIAATLVEEPEADRAKLVGTLINRYPYLYEHCLLSQDSSYEHQQTVRQIRDQIQKKFERDLSQYATYQVRLAQAARTGKIIQPVSNPTLLSDQELAIALKQFAGKVKGNSTHRDLANSFLSRSLQASSYRAFKNELYEYLTASIDPKYGKRQFNDKLHQHLQNTLDRYDHQKPNETLFLRTLSHLLNFLVVESTQRPSHYIFVDLVTNLGATNTVVLLLKLTLLCQQIKPSLEKRFSILFSHYEEATEAGVPWLVQSMENVHIAFSVHFGDADVSVLKNIL